MRIVYYTHTAFFDVALSIAGVLSRRAELHLILEMAPQSWCQTAFNVDRRELPGGLVPADPVLRDLFPSSVRDLWAATASFQLAVHTQPRSISAEAFATSRRVIRFVESTGAHVLHVDDVDVTPRLPIALPTLGRTPLVLSVHDPDPHSSERNWRKSLSRTLAFPRARRFVLFNESQQPAFREKYHIEPERIMTARLGTYELLGHWASAARSGPPIVLFFGRLSDYKGLPTFLRAMSLLSERVPDLRVVVAGRPVGGYRVPPIRPLARGGTIELIERYIDNAEASSLFRSAAVVACPYDDATQSGIVLTAYGFGVPVVASRVGGMPEYVRDGETGLLVPPREPEALACALEHILTDAGRAFEMRRRIEALRQTELHWGRTADDLMRVYDETTRTPLSKGRIEANVCEVRARAWPKP